MSIQLKLTIGQNQVTITGEDEKKLIEQASFFSQLPCKCGNCGSEQIGFTHSRAQETYDYYNMRCRDCGWEYKFGMRKSDKGLFPKPDEDSVRKGQKGWVAPYSGGSGGGRDEEEHSPPPRRSAPPARRAHPQDDDDTRIPY